MSLMLKRCPFCDALTRLFLLAPMVLLCPHLAPAQVAAAEIRSALDSSGVLGWFLVYITDSRDTSLEETLDRHTGRVCDRASLRLNDRDYFLLSRMDSSIGTRFGIDSVTVVHTISVSISK